MFVVFVFLCRIKSSVFGILAPLYMTGGRRPFICRKVDGRSLLRAMPAGPAYANTTLRMPQS